MSRKSTRILAAALALWLLAITCNLPSGAQPISLSDEDIANTAVVKILAGQPVAAASDTPAPPEPQNPPTATQCQPMVTANTNANVRAGPGTAYDIVGYLPTGGTAGVAGRNDDSSWWYIVFPGGSGGYAWIAGSVATASCIPPAIQVVAAPPLPTAPPPKDTKTPKQPLVILTVYINPNLFLGDIELQDVFLSTGDEVIARVGVNPANSLSGSMTYKVWVDGGLKATKTVSLPAGSIAYWSGVVISGSHTVRVKVDTPNQYNESDEGNNEMTVMCNSASHSCN